MSRQKQRMLDFDLSLDDHDKLNEMAHSELEGNFM